MLGIIGDLVEDVIVWPSGPIRHGTDTPAEVFHTRGGSGANVASFAARLGPTRFIGSVGSDRLGDSLVAQLEEDGVDVRVTRRGSTGSIVILIDPSGERSMLPHRAAATMLDNVPDEWVDDLDLLHVPGYSFDAEPLATAAIRSLERAHARGIRTSIDASSTDMLARFGRDRFLDLIARLRPTLLIANESEAHFLGLEHQAGHQPDLTDTTVVVKHGAAPTTVLRDDEEILTVSVPRVTDIRDLTGAGDAFAAGFLTAFVTDGDLEAACVAGHACAAQVLASPGATRRVGT